MPVLRDRSSGANRPPIPMRIHGRDSSGPPEFLRRREPDVQGTFGVSKQTRLAPGRLPTLT